MEKYQNGTTIKQWAEDDRPREKLLLKGRHALSDAELLAILLGTGIKGLSAVDLAKQILVKSGDNLLELSRLSVNDLVKNFKGIGEAKAIGLIAALELGNRKRTSAALEKQRIATSRDAFEYLRGIMGDSQYEEFWMIILNRANKVIQKICISVGGIAGTVVDPKKVFKIALENNGSGIILAHNHPSGNVQPSESDIHLTRRLKEAGNILDMPVTDHIIIGDEKYFSFADEGMI